MKSETTVGVSKKTHAQLKDLKEFFECHSQEEVIQYGLVSLIEKELVKTDNTNREKINFLCGLLKQVAPKLR